MANDKTGILGEKLGMTQVFDENNRIVPVTVVKAGPCVVTQIRTQEKDGYTAVQLAYGQIDPRKVTKPVAGHYKAANVTPRRHLVELRTDAIEGYENQTTQSLTVHKVDAEKGLLLIKGAVPGPTGGLVLVRSAAKGGV